MNEVHFQGEIIVQRYQIVTLLGQGGMGSTYAAVDLNNHKRVALKVVSLINTKDWKILELFEREAQVLKNINHPFIPDYLDYFSIDTPTDKKFYLIQELVEGESLSQLVKIGKTFTEEEVKDIASQILEILIYIHSLNPPIIHRDIKPDNIICRQDGKVYLVDFGAVKNVARNTKTFASTFVGTMGYMPLEQLRGQTYPNSDLYSLGTTLIYLLTGKEPSDLPKKSLKIDFNKYLKVNISKNFEQWLIKLIEPVREDRFSHGKDALLQLNSNNNFNKISNQNLTDEIKHSYNPRIKISKKLKKLNIKIERKIGFLDEKIKESLMFLIFSIAFPIGLIVLLSIKEHPNILKQNLNILTPKNKPFLISLAIVFLVLALFNFDFIKGIIFLSLLPPLFCSPVVIIYLSINLLISLSKIETNLEITPETFILTKTPRLSSRSKIVRGNTKDIYQISLEHIDDRHIIIWEGIKGHILVQDHHFTLEDYNFIVEEIQNFLEEIDTR